MRFMRYFPCYYLISSPPQPCEEMDLPCPPEGSGRSKVRPRWVPGLPSAGGALIPPPDWQLPPGLAVSGGRAGREVWSASGSLQEWATLALAHQVRVGNSPPPHRVWLGCCFGPALSCWSPLICPCGMGALQGRSEKGHHPSQAGCACGGAGPDSPHLVTL